jgi:PAS domain S-box-containing protein
MNNQLQTFAFFLFVAGLPGLPLGTAQAEARADQQLATVIDTIPDIIFYKDLEGVYRGGNRAWSSLVGRPLEEIIGKTDFDLFPEEVARSFRGFDEQMLSELSTSRNDEWVRYPDGRKLLLDTLKTPWVDAQGNVLGVLGICRDITPREAQEGQQTDVSLQEAVMVANARFYDALAAMFDGDLSVMQEVWSHADDVSLQGPFGGRMEGWDAVESHFVKESKMGMAGRVHCMNPLWTVGTDMASVSCREVGEDMTVNGDPVAVDHRATNVFRLEDGEWKMVHHHTDMSPTLDTADE